MMNNNKNEEVKGTIDPFPLSVIEITSGDIERALSSFDEDVQKIVIEIDIFHDVAVSNEIKEKIRDELMYNFSSLLHYAIKDVFEDEIQKVKAKRTFIRCWSEILKKRKGEVNIKKQ